MIGGDWLDGMLDDAILLISKLNEAERDLLLDTCVEAAVTQRAARRIVCLGQYPANQSNRPLPHSAGTAKAGVDGQGRTVAAK